MKYKFYCDSGANIHSRREEVIDTADFGFPDEVWLGMSDANKEAELRDIHYDWMHDGFESGWYPIEEKQ